MDLHTRVLVTRQHGTEKGSVGADHHPLPGDDPGVWWWHRAIAGRLLDQLSLAGEWDPSLGPHVRTTVEVVAVFATRERVLASAAHASPPPTITQLAALVEAAWNEARVEAQALVFAHDRRAAV
jgi:hypothetical protein